MKIHLLCQEYYLLRQEQKMAICQCLTVFVVTWIIYTSAYGNQGSPTSVRTYEIFFSVKPSDNRNLHKVAQVDYSAVLLGCERCGNDVLYHGLLLPSTWIFTGYIPTVCYINGKWSMNTHNCSCGKFDTVLIEKYPLHVTQHNRVNFQVTEDLKSLYHCKSYTIKLRHEKAKVDCRVTFECYRDIYSHLNASAYTDYPEKNQLLITCGGCPVIEDSKFAELMIPPKSRGRPVNLVKHPLASSTKIQKEQNKQFRIDTSGQIHTNLLNESGDMSTPWRTANRKELFRGCHTLNHNNSRILRTDFVKVHLLNKKAASMTQYSPHLKNELSKLIFVDYKNIIHRETRIPSGLQHRKTENDLPRNPIKGIYFSEYLEDMCKVAFLNYESSGWWSRWKLQDVYKMEKTGCGSGQNRLVIFKDGTKACARYRPNIDQIQGEIFSYYLSRLLGLNNVPRPMVTKIDTNARHWSRVRDFVASAQWSTQTPFVLTRWIENLTETHIPRELLGSSEKLFQGMFSVNNKSLHDICQILQWTDLIIFDFLTGHLDRVINMMHNSRWSPRIFSKPVHNLLASKTSANLVFLDNESGLIHGYRGLDTFAAYHERLLKSVCIFRLRTAAAIGRLHHNGNIGHELYALFSSEDVNYKLIPVLPPGVLRTLQHRISLVNRHIKTCESTRII
ncbi:uncharacterized protein LOC135461476 [Liolophura sinensis]|uniref:uncharacterized protein LOC135461476 n=1 Tax=Liolophura sinensis TaxID=3198878 RepID=UPI0031585130